MQNKAQTRNQGHLLDFQSATLSQTTPAGITWITYLSLERGLLFVGFLLSLDEFFEIFHRSCSIPKWTKEWE